VGILILYALAKLLHLVLPRACGRRRWEVVTPTNRKTMVIYVLQIVRHNQGRPLRLG